MSKETYERQKENARQYAIRRSQWVFEHAVSYEELARTQDDILTVARRFGLVKELRDSGILWKANDAGKQVNPMCLGCQHLNRACTGTNNRIWTDCIMRDQEPEKAEKYISHMTEKILEGGR